MTIGIGTAPATQVGSTSNATSYATSSWTPDPFGLVLAFVLHRGDNTQSPGVTHTGLSFSLISGPLAISADTTLEVWASVAPASPSASTTTVGTWSVSRTGCHLFVQSFTGVAVVGGVGPGAGTAIVQLVDSGNTGSAATSVTATLAAAAAVANRAVSWNGHRANEATTPRANWTELNGTTFTTPASAAEAQWRRDLFETTASATWTTGSLGRMVALELNAATEIRQFPAVEPLPLIPRGRSM